MYRKVILRHKIPVIAADHQILWLTVTLKIIAFCADSMPAKPLKHLQILAKKRVALHQRPLSLESGLAVAAWLHSLTPISILQRSTL
jgi:hypothetical protein